jgi:ATPase subunit of ABC transporter with duplicated ATPase domains
MGSARRERTSPVSSISARINEQEPNVFERFFKSFSNAEDTDTHKIQKQNEKNLSRIFELLNKKPRKSLEPSAALATSRRSSNDESTSMIKFLLKMETSEWEAAASGAGSEASIEQKIEVEADKLDAALSIYNNCPTTLSKILLSTKNAILVDTSHQPGLLVLSSSSEMCNCFFFLN